ncbi:transposase family protein [Streptomyces sp. JJ66]|uniref:helix-turn-helix domain-containing protein n=1 Tax=Streptomyces sp. JJ66 TaxID=2803843 RepID=UPI001C55AC14|nr:transposase family protein [Streptomyces sp. JJ66]MBW1601822.1 transposase family protein [Streptomyces sp. JJ66]
MPPEGSEAGGSWRALTSWDQAMMLLVWLAKGDTFAQLGAHFGVSTDPAWRYVNEGIAALAPLAPTPPDGLQAAGPGRRLLLDGTLIPTWRCAAQATEATPTRSTTPSTATTGGSPGPDHTRR